VNISISFIVGVVATYLYTDAQKVSDIQSLVEGYTVSEVVESAQIIDRINLVRENNVKEFYRSSCLSLKTNYMIVSDAPIKIEYNEWQQEIISQTKQFIKQYEEQGLCSTNK
jgi:hypothetical protein